MTEKISQVLADNPSAVCRSGPPEDSEREVSEIAPAEEGEESNSPASRSDRTATTGMVLYEEKGDSPGGSTAPEAPLLEDFRPDALEPRIAHVRGEGGAPRNF